MQPISGEPADRVDVNTAAIAAAIEEVNSLLALSSAPDGRAFVKMVSRVVHDFAVDRLIAPIYGAPSKQRKIIQQAGRSLEKTWGILSQVSPEYFVTIAGMAERMSDSGPPGRSMELLDDIARMKIAIDQFLLGYALKIGAPVDVPLEEAVRSLLALIEDRTGNIAVVAMNKNKHGGPTLASPEALAIGLLLQAADPAMTVTAIVNMIQKVRVQPKPSEDHLSAIWKADPEAELDLANRRSSRSDH